jgi:hypothetical protein
MAAATDGFIVQLGISFLYEPARSFRNHPSASGDFTPGSQRFERIVFTSLVPGVCDSARGQVGFRRPSMLYTGMPLYSEVTVERLAAVQSLSEGAGASLSLLAATTDVAQFRSGKRRLSL